MKKIINFTLMIIALIIVPGLIFIYHNTSSQRYNTKEMKQYNDFYYYSVTDEQAEDTISYIEENVMSKIPESIKNTLIDDDWIICIVKNIGEEYKNNVVYTPPTGTEYHLSGITISLSRIIMIQYTDDKNEIANVILHEIGHAMNYEYGFACASKEFSDIYRNEIDKIKIDDYCKVSKEEYFPELFKEYLLKDSLASQSVKANDYYKKLIESNTIHDGNLFSKFKMTTIGSYRIVLTEIENLTSQKPSER